MKSPIRRNARGLTYYLHDESAAFPLHLAADLSQDGDARQMPFEKESFDVILSSWALHNIYDSAGRRRALKEIVRVLKPGGRVLITDVRHAHEYADVFRSLGLTEVKVSAPTFIFVIPSRCVRARKAA